MPTVTCRAIGPQHGSRVSLRRIYSRQIVDVPAVGVGGGRENISVEGLARFGTVSVEVLQNLPPALLACRLSRHHILSRGRSPTNPRVMIADRSILDSDQVLECPTLADSGRSRRVNGPPRLE